MTDGGILTDGGSPNVDGLEGVVVVVSELVCLMRRGMAKSVDDGLGASWSGVEEVGSSSFFAEGGSSLTILSGCCCC